ncbi:hypothetical protein [Pectobacterium wasabiae]|uniref:hypothetical protein n=1 Tax=Pectobacterium wasabiae TaxID=55208 RepID=UPI000A5091CA|nr:hypothetical protein [Pectobacterium wasabiae]
MAVEKMPVYFHGYRGSASDAVPLKGAASCKDYRLLQDCRWFLKAFKNKCLLKIFIRALIARRFDSQT